MKKSLLFNSFGSMLYYLDNKQKRYAVLMLFLILVSSILDIFGLASIIPVILSASQPGFVEKNKYLHEMFVYGGFVSEHHFVLFLIGVIFVFFLLKSLFTIVVNYKQALFIAQLSIQIIDSQFTKYYKLPYWEFNNLGSGKLTSYIIQTPEMYRRFVLQPLFVLASESMIVGIIVLGIALYKPLLLLILFLVLGPSVLFTYRTLKNKAQKIGQELDDLRPETYSLLSDSFMGYIELKLANKQKILQERYLENQKKYQRLEAISFLYNSIPQKIIEFIAVIGIIIIIMYSILFSSQSSTLLVLVGLFAAAAYRLMPSINRILNALISLKREQYAIDNLNMYRDFNKNNKPASARKSPKNLTFKKSLEFKDVYFSFPDANQPVLKGVNFSISKGEKVGFVGSSGSGKTTLMNLLLRFYTEDKGSIMVDHTMLDESNIDNWRSRVGYVKQNVFIMKSTIKENITLGDPVTDLNKLNQAIDQASLREFVDSLPNGIETHVGELGSKLSGGQRQRLGIARALYKQAEVLVFDEATSALDNETEREVTEAISKLSDTNITMLIVAHRLTTLKDCDRIFELQNGKIVGAHQYSELVKTII